MSRAEDGVMLADGTLIVADQRYELIRIEPSGKVSPFGNFEALGYEHNPPEVDSGPNGVHLTPDKQYVVTADVFTGKIYKTSNNRRYCQSSKKIKPMECRRINLHRYFKGKNI